MIISKTLNKYFNDSIPGLSSLFFFFLYKLKNQIKSSLGINPSIWSNIILSKICKFYKITTSCENCFGLLSKYLLQMIESVTGFSSGSDKSFEFSKSQTQTFLCKHFFGLPCWLSGKESACSSRSTGNTGSIPGSGRSPEGEHGNPLQYSCLESLHGQRSLGGYSSQIGKESNILTRLSIHARTRTCIQILKTTHFKILCLKSIYIFSMRL